MSNYTCPVSALFQFQLQSVIWHTVLTSFLFKLFTFIIPVAFTHVRCPVGLQSSPSSLSIFADFRGKGECVAQPSAWNLTDALWGRLQSTTNRVGEKRQWLNRSDQIEREHVSCLQKKICRSNVVWLSKIIKPKNSKGKESQSYLNILR